MKQALTEEQKNREQLQAELAKARADRPAATGAIRPAGQELQQKQSNLEQQYASAQANIQTLNQKLQEATRSLTQEQLAAKEAEIQEAEGPGGRPATAIAQLNSQLHAARHWRNASPPGKSPLMQQQMEAEHAQNARLAEGVKALATNSGALTQEIRENRPLAPNTIFDEFIKNRVQTSFVASRTGLFGIDASKSKTTETVLVTDGTKFTRCATCRTRR